jgi:hypothetical protein
MTGEFLMHPFLSTCRIVQVNNPYDQWRDPLVRELFEKATTLKFADYGCKYPKGVIPADTSSWFCDHLLVCQEHNGLQPIIGFQRVTLDRCRSHYRSFSPLAICEEAGDERHSTEMKKLISQFDSRPHKLSYTGSFTVDPELRSDRELTKELVHLMVVLHYFLHLEEGEGHEYITGGAIRFKIDALLMRYGFFPLLESKEENEIDTLALHPYAGEEVRLMRCQQFNQEMVQLAEQYLPMWQNRMVLRSDSMICL